MCIPKVLRCIINVYACDDIRGFLLDFFTYHRSDKLLVYTPKTHVEKLCGHVGK